MSNGLGVAPVSLPARLSAAVALSLAAHLLLAWGAAGWIGDADASAGGRSTDLQVRLAAGPAATAPRTQGRGAVRYWPVSQLDVRPQISSHVMPEYPADLPSGVNGRVVLELYLSPQGAIDRVHVIRAEPSGRFEQSAVKAFSSARFTPGMRKGKAVHSRLRIEVTYGD